MQTAHHVHRLRQGGGFAIVEVRVGQFDIAGSVGTLEGKPIGILAGDYYDPRRVAGFVRLDLAHFLEGIAANVRAIVTGHTTAVLESLVAAQLLGAQRLFIALQPLVKAAVRVTRVSSKAAIAVVTLPMSMAGSP